MFTAQNDFFFSSKFQKMIPGQNFIFHFFFFFFFFFCLFVFVVVAKIFVFSIPSIVLKTDLV